MSALFDPSLISVRSIAWLALLLDASVKGLIILTAAGLVCLALRRASAASRHLVWSLAMVSLIALPILSALLPALQIPILPRPALQLADGGRSGVSPDAKIAAGYHREADETPALPLASLYAEPTSVEIGNESEISPELTIKAKIRDHLREYWPAWILSVWTLGAVAALAPLLVGMAGVWRRARHATPIAEGVCLALLPELTEKLGVRSRVSLLQSDSSIIPTTCGALRPIILLPRDAERWPEEKCRIVLLHELAHIRRREWLAQTVARIACSLHWFNPLAWLAARRLRVESEQACDDSVLRAGYKASGYADQLLDIVRGMARSRCASVATVPIARSSRIERRVAALLDATRNRRALTRLSVILALIAMSCALLPLAAIRTTTRSAEARGAPAYGKPASAREREEMLKEIGLALKMYGAEHHGVFPPKVADARSFHPETEELMMFLEKAGDGSELVGYLTGRRGVHLCYLGYVVLHEKAAIKVLDSFQHPFADRDDDLRFSAGPAGLGPKGGTYTIHRLREGIERFFIDDINDPAAAARAQSTIPILWEIPGGGDAGGWVLYMDGHIEWKAYPGEFPMTERFVARLRELMGLAAVEETVSGDNASAMAGAGDSAAGEPGAEPTDEATLTEGHLSDEARRGIRARAEYLGSKQVRIEYTHTIKRDAGQPPLRYDCILLAHGGNYREERTDSQGRTVHNYFYNGLRVEVGQLWKGKAKCGGSDELVPTRFLMGLPPADATDVVAVAPRVSYHKHSLIHTVELTIVKQLTGPGDSYLAEMERRGAVKAGQVVDGIRCVQFGDDRNARYYAPDLGWALVGTGPQSGSYRAMEFEKTGNVYFPRKIARGPSGRGRRTVEIKNVAIADGSLFSPDLVVPPHEPEEGAVVQVLCPLGQASDVIVEERGWGSYNFPWRKDLSPEHRRILEASLSRWRRQDFEETVETGFPLPFYDDERKQIVWAKYDQDLGKYLKIHECDDPPDRFGPPPWNDLLYLVAVESDQESVLRTSGAAGGQAGDPAKGPWLELRLLSHTPVPGYKQVTTPQGEKYYCAPTSYLDPLGFADVLPASNGNGLTIVLTPAAAKRVGEFTSEHVGDPIGILVDGELVRGPIVIGEPMTPRRMSLPEELGKDVCDSLIRAWSAPPDTSPGRHKLHIQGIGTIETELHDGSPGDFTFLHDGSLYGLPLAFVSRPELNPKEKTVQEAVIGEDSMTVGDERFATVQEALAYIKNQAGPKRLVLVTISKEQADTWPEARLTELMPLMHYLHSDAPYVGLRQRMPDGWAWPTSENAPEAVAQPDEGERAEPLGADLIREIDSYVAEQAREAPYVPAHLSSQMETLEAESLRDSLDNLSDMTLFDLLPTREGMRFGRFPMPPREGRFDIRCILGNKRVLKLLKELGDLPKAEAGALVQEHLMAALSEYQSAFQELFGPDRIGPPRRVQPGEESAGRPTPYTRRYEILSLALIAGHLELESTFPAVLELAQYAREQREYLGQCYLTDKIPEDRAYDILADGSLYNRLVIPTALVGTSGAERKATLMQKLRSYDVPFTTEKLTTYDAFLTPHDIIVGPGRWPPDYSKGTIEVSFITGFTDDGFDRVLAEVTK